MQGERVTEKIIEWNLAFAADEVVAGVEKLLAKIGYAFFRTERAEETYFQAKPPQGTLSCLVRPLASHRSPFNLQVTLHRTLLIVTYSEFSPQMEEILQRSMTLAFLRVGG
jgi:hypothetical protein